ncbi:glycosyltransferase [Dysgonomonas sp. BGC7]|uniref:glycosyltransferase n=1 Tax=Dysgonomonas sp. BGC7 TaxID=1658008 RepID=UPI000B1CE5CD|nr:glycosyltransferase [Dysgonomonas sp. BGC7]MBD8389762.1 glycosyltransferase [Dysgonomonas sp. BGC7]
MKDSKIILITNEFPFGKRETFLESEIEFLSQKFDNIVIVPSKGCDCIRETPPNITIDYSLIHEFKKKYFWIFKSIFSIHSFTTLIIYGRLCLKRKKMMNLLKYMVAYTIFDDNIHTLVKKYSSSLVYSYWFSPVVEVLVNKKKEDDSFKIITRVHRGDLYEEISPLGFFPFRDKMIYKIDKVVAISTHGLSYLKNKYNLDNIEVSKLGTINKNGISKCSSSENISIVSVSNIIDVKRVYLIAESIVELASLNTGFNVIWNHFGDGPQRLFVEDILEKANVVNLKYKFHGMVSNNKIFDFYRNENIDLFINLSSSEGVPVSIMEAISFGIPILATNVGGVSEIVNDTTGILLEEELLKEKISASIIKMKKINYDRSKIIKFWDDNYNAEINYNSFSDIIKYML